MKTFLHLTIILLSFSVAAFGDISRDKLGKSGLQFLNEKVIYFKTYCAMVNFYNLSYMKSLPRLNFGVS